MKKATITLQLIIIVFVLSNIAFSNERESQGTALIIGNSAYKISPIKNPVNDARDIAHVLEKLGFKVIFREDIGQRDMEESIREFGTYLRKGGAGLFYYAGHGIQVKDQNYLVPVDAEIYQETDIKYEAVNASLVLDEMYNAGNKLNIIILDACRDNPFGRSFRSQTRGLARMDAPTGTIISYATAPGNVAADGIGEHSVYTKNLLKYISVPGLTIEQVFKNVRVEVVKETNNEQVPWESSSLTGDFYFVPKKTDESLYLKAEATYAYWERCRQITDSYFSLLHDIEFKKEIKDIDNDNAKELVDKLKTTLAILSELADKIKNIPSYNVDAELLNLISLTNDIIRGVNKDLEFIIKMSDKMARLIDQGYNSDEAREKMKNEYGVTEHKIYMMENMKKDMDNLFEKYRVLRVSLSKKYNREFLRWDYLFRRTAY